MGTQKERQFSVLFSENSFFYASRRAFAGNEHPDAVQEKYPARAPSDGALLEKCRRLAQIVSGYDSWKLTPSVGFGIDER
jgi:hypothetical protein